jgi:hypothetical protein
MLTCTHFAGDRGIIGLPDNRAGRFPVPGFNLHSVGSWCLKSEKTHPVRNCTITSTHGDTHTG